MDASSLEQIVDIADRLHALSPEDAAAMIAEFVTQIRRFDASDADRRASFLMIGGIALSAANQLARPRLCASQT